MFELKVLEKETRPVSIFEFIVSNTLFLSPSMNEATISNAGEDFDIEVVDDSTVTSQHSIVSTQMPPQLPNQTPKRQPSNKKAVKIDEDAELRREVSVLRIFKMLIICDFRFKKSNSVL